MKSVELNRSLFEDAVRAMPDDVLSTLRNEAARKFQHSGFPSPRLEDWRYTNLTPAIDLSNRWLAAGAHAGPDRLDEDPPILDSIDAVWFRIRNGVIDNRWGELPDGVTIGLSPNGENNGKVTDIAIDDALAQWNAALLSDVLAISIAPGTTIDLPLAFLLDDVATSGPLVTQVRIVIDVGAGARVRLIEAHASLGGGDHYANVIVQLDLASESSVDYVRVQQRGRTHVQTGKLTATIAKDAELRHCAIDLGGALIRNDLAALLQGPGAAVTMNGLYLAGDQQHIDNHTRTDHCVGPTCSSEEYRGILNRHSRAVFNGKVVVHKGADGADASQTNHNLLLSNDAEIDTKPELEIYADDVKCSHGTTVGQLDDSALFYLRSRGLDVNTATQLLTRAFASCVLRDLRIDAARDYIATAVDERLDTLIGETGNE